MNSALNKDLLAVALISFFFFTDSKGKKKYYQFGTLNILKMY